MSTNLTGYSGTPLAKKLGISAGALVVTVGAPADYQTWLAPLPDGVRFSTELLANMSFIHLFATQKNELQSALQTVHDLLNRNGAIWVSWPKKASKQPTNITEDTIRELALPMGLVDIKVCSVTEVWSGLKLVIRRQLR